MKKRVLLLAIAIVCVGVQMLAADVAKVQSHKPIEIEEQWKSYYPGAINFWIENHDSEGAKIYKNIIPNPYKYITDNALRVLQTLYSGPDDENIPEIEQIDYVVRNFDGISYKSGGGNRVRIDYSTRWIERNFANADTVKLDYETRGVIYHELTHAYQLVPQGCGHYDGHSENWVFIEGLADAVRVACGCFEQDFASADRPKGGSWRSGYRITGYFLYWLQLNKDKDFIRKFNKSAAEINPWSWNAAMHHILGEGEQFDVDNLWKEYQHSVGDDLLPDNKKQPVPRKRRNKKN